MMTNQWFALLLILVTLHPVPALGASYSVYPYVDIVQAVPAFYDNTVYPQPEDPLLKSVRQAKGQRIGIGERGAIALRFDDWQNYFKTLVQDELKVRELPASMALIAGFQAIEWGSQCTWEDITHWNRQGLEIWSHGIDHRDYADFAGLVHNIVGSKRIIEAHDLKVQGFALPGVWKYYNPRPYGLLVSSGDYDQIPGRLIRQTYALSEAYVWGRSRSLPQTEYHGADHLTISDGRFSYDEIIRFIDDAIQNRSGLEMMVHSGNLGKPGKLSLEDFLRILDYIVQQRDSNNLAVLTPSGLMFADQREDRMQLLTIDGSIPFSTSPAYDPQRTVNDGIADDHLELPADGSPLRIPLTGLVRRQADGESFELLVQCADDEGTLSLEVVDAEGKLISRTQTEETNEAGLKRLVFIIPPGSDEIQFAMTATGKVPVQVLSISVRKI